MRSLKACCHQSCLQILLPILSSWIRLHASFVIANHLDHVQFAITISAAIIFTDALTVTISVAAAALMIIAPTVIGPILMPQPN